MGQENVSFRQKWDQARATKTVVFWIIIGAMGITMIVGFNWGGWVTGGTAQKMGEAMAQEAVTERLASICVFQFNQDPQKAEKLTELKKAVEYQRADYVKGQGWSKMPGEDDSNYQVGDACAKMLVQTSQ